jgi:selenocysteine lyase/cysteine desulfurase
MKLAPPVQRQFTPAASRIPPVVGAGLMVPLATGSRTQYANLDHAASAPCLSSVQTVVGELLPWYASVHRGAGFASQVSTRVYEQARDVLREFVGARPDDAVIFTRNTTDSLNLLARSLPESTSVLLFDTDHHAALLPWQGPRVHRIKTPLTAAATVVALDRALAGAAKGPRLVVVTGASNVTGELWPVAELAGVAHRHGARVVLDAAQLAPHRPIDVQALNVDYVALSGHKLYAPFGAGALIGRADWLQSAEPYLAGGGATKQVVPGETKLGVDWCAVPERHEAGSPNVVGVHALAAACTALSAQWPEIEAHERALLRQLRVGLHQVPGLAELNIFEGPRVGVVSFTIKGHDAGLLAAALSAEYGIGVRDGAFCAHIATRRLLAKAGSTEQRALRASLGLGTTSEHIGRLVNALHTLVNRGPALNYRLDDGRWVPEHDTRPMPSLLFS